MAPSPDGDTETEVARTATPIPTDRIDPDHKHDPQPDVDPHPRTERARHGIPLATPPSVQTLSLTRERTKQPVDEFISQWHSLSPVPGWKACFSARYQGQMVAVCVVGRPVAREADNGYEELSITRYCSRPDRPQNTGSWLIARAREWGRLEGYDRLTAHAGVAGNWGDVYAAAGFECVDETDVDGSQWNSSDRDRKVRPDYTRRKWVYEFDS